jgi:sigma-B regulation protein RsbU (phosphoserine phosphatase)
VEAIFPIPTRIFYQTHFFPLLKMQGEAAEIFIFLQTRIGNQLPVLVNATRELVNGLAFNNCACIVVKNRKKFEDELVSAKKLAESMLQENTALKTAQEELRLQSEKLEEQFQLVKKRNDELKQITRAITHNLQEPLRKTVLFANILSSQDPGSAEHKERLQRLMHQVHNMRNSVHGLQQYVWLNESELKAELLDLDKIVKSATQQLEQEFGPGLLLLSTEKLPPVEGDQHQVYQLFYQVLKNSLEYRKPGNVATVTVSSTVVKKNRFKTLRDRYKYQEYVRIVIRDEGIGFDPQFNQQVFDLFKRLHHSDRMGIGLSLCKLVVEKHGGWIAADGKPQQGTSVTIFFPLHNIKEQGT